MKGWVGKLTAGTVMYLHVVLNVEQLRFLFERRMSTPTTPRGKPSTPSSSAARVPGSHIIQSSPHYATTRRHSLYGVEDRVIIDPGSQMWKVGFSGEGRPRDVFYACGPDGGSLWSLKRASDPVVRAEEDKLLEVRLQKALRSVFHE